MVKKLLKRCSALLMVVVVGCCLLSRVHLFCDPMDYSPLGSSIQGISQARILEWAISFSRGSSRPRDQTHISCVGREFCTTEPPQKPIISHLGNSNKNHSEIALNTH